MITVSAPAQQRGGGGRVLTVLATPVAVAAYAFVRTLQHVTPAAPVDGSAVAGSRHHLAGRLASFFAAAYRRSLLYEHLHRHGPPCRFIPSCTEYAVRAVEKQGLRRGLWMAAERFRRCRPAYQGDYVDFP